AMAKTTLGIFDDPIAARHALDTLRASSLQLDDVSIISRATESGGAISNSDDVSAGEGAAVGAVWGGLVGLAALLIPGVGPFVAFGALGAALTGAVTGAVVGGITAALIDFGGIPEDDARGYEQQVHAGKTLLAVKSRDEDTIEVRRILAAAGAESIRDNQTDLTNSTSTPVRVDLQDGSGRDVSEAMEYGAPPNPTTTRRGIYDMPPVDRDPDMATPSIEGRPAIDNLNAARAGQVEPRQSGAGVDSGSKDITTPETLGSTDQTKRP
ncbi:MAG TPA: hypothetical protein VFU22_28895, partial [Roseiflexaceae bacterium]|nr:hypothetical protein [Roseiflexaceae bacterium]